LKEFFVQFKTSFQLPQRNLLLTGYLKFVKTFLPQETIFDTANVQTVVKYIEKVCSLKDKKGLTPPILFTKLRYR
jgi:hypothetical protein